MVAWSAAGERKTSIGQIGSRGPLPNFTKNILPPTNLFASPRSTSPVVPAGVLGPDVGLLFQLAGDFDVAG